MSGLDVSEGLGHPTRVTSILAQVRKLRSSHSVHSIPPSFINQNSGSLASHFSIQPVPVASKMNVMMQTKKNGAQRNLSLFVSTLKIRNNYLHSPKFDLVALESFVITFIVCFSIKY